MLMLIKNSRKVENFSSKIRNKKRLTILSVLFNKYYLPQQSNKKHKINASKLKKEGSKNILTYQQHDTVHIEYLKVSTKKKE